MDTIKKYFTLTRRQQFLGQLFLLTLCGHILVLFLCTFAYKESPERFMISSSQKYNTVYVLSPLNKQIRSSSKQFGIKSVKASKVIDYGTYQQLKKQQKKQSKNKNLSVQNSANKSKVVVPVKARKTSKALANGLAASKHDKQSMQKKVSLTISQVKIIMPAESKDDVVSEIVKKKDIAQEVIKEEKIQKSLEPVISIQEKVAEEISKQDVAKEKACLIVDESTSETVDEDLDVDNVTFIGYEQLDTLAVQNKIQQVIQQSFKSPIGIKKDVACELTVSVDDSGKSKKVTIVRSSGVLVYDTSARAMLCNIEFPKEVWNKTITIVLGQ